MTPEQLYAAKRMSASQAAALVSSLVNVTLPARAVYFGEVSLSGAVRAASHTALRLKEAKKLGFDQAVIPSSGDAGGDMKGLSLNRLGHLKELAVLLGSCD